MTTLLAVCLGAALPRTGAQFSWVEVTDQDALQQGEVLTFASARTSALFFCCAAALAACSMAGKVSVAASERMKKRARVPAAHPPICLVNFAIL